MRNWLRRRRFTKAFKSTLDARKSELDPQEYKKCRAACDDKKKMTALMGQLKTAPGLKGGIKDWDWDSILDWIRDYLIPIIKTLLPLIMMLDERQ